MEKELFKKVTNDAVVRRFYENGRKRTEIWPKVRQSFFLFFLEWMILSFLCLKLTCSFSFSLSRDDLEYFGQLWHAILAILSCDVNWILDLYNSGEACRYIFFQFLCFFSSIFIFLSIFSSNFYFRNSFLHILSLFSYSLLLWLFYFHTFCDLYVFANIFIHSIFLFTCRFNCSWYKHNEE